MPTNLQKKTAQAIVNIFETGRVRGNYAAVTFHPDDPGHLTYGRSQTTLASGNLYLLIKAYCDKPQAEFGTELRSYLPALAQRDTILDRDLELRQRLAKAGEDLVMHEVQDRFFDRVYWDPSAKAAENEDITSALGTGVVYDSYVHGSWKLMRDRTNSAGSAGAVGEREWISQYVVKRKAWLANHQNTLLQKTIYRMDAFQQLIKDNKWDLPLPLRVRGVEITESVLLEESVIRVSAYMDVGERTLRLETPLMRGEDVRAVQEALKQNGISVTVDGVFGKESGNAVVDFQKKKGLTADGIVGPATRTALGV